MTEPSLKNFLFGTSDDYHQLNAGTHRKPPKNLNAPALVWHTASWIKADRSVQKPDQVKDAVDDFILTLSEAIEPKVKSFALTPCVNKVRLLFNCVCPDISFKPEKIELDPRQRDIFASASRAVSIKFEWDGLDVAIRFDIHTEYLAISTFIELDKLRRGPPYTTRIDLAENIERMLDYLKNGDRTQAYSLNRYFFGEFWRKYEEEILSADSLSGFMKGRPCGQIFADFRGLVLSEQAVEFPGADDFLTKQSPLNWGFAAKSKLLPLMQDERRYECAVNYMLDGRAFYMSTLGPQLPSKPASERIPLEFIVYAIQRSNTNTIVNKWQLGRLVGEILLLETLRLCALKDVSLLHEAGRELSRLDQSTQAAREAIASKKHEARNPKKDQPDGTQEVQPVTPGTSNDNMAMELIQEAHEKLNDITGNFLTATGSGLLYRIERSRYYVKQFKDTVELLRVKRLEGDQPYNQFIARRLGSEFDFIDRLGIRYERATRNIVTLDQNYLAITQNALVEKANRIDEETKGIQGDIHTIQEWGEFALLAALVPYYVMHLLDLVIQEELVPVTTLIVWTIFGAIALLRKFEKYGYALALVAVVVAVVCLRKFDVLDYSKFLRFPEKPGEQLSTQKEMLEVHRKLEKLQDEQVTLLKELLAAQTGRHEIPKEGTSKEPEPPPR